MPNNRKRSDEIFKIRLPSLYQFRIEISRPWEGEAPAEPLGNGSAGASPSQITMGRSKPKSVLVFLLIKLLFQKKSLIRKSV